MLDSVVIWEAEKYLGKREFQNVMQTQRSYIVMPQPLLISKDQTFSQNYIFHNFYNRK